MNWTCISGRYRLQIVYGLLCSPKGVPVAIEVFEGNTAVETVNHPFATFPDLESDSGEATEKLRQAIDIAATLGARYIYLLTGGRGSLTWEQGAARFAELVTPCKAAAAAQGMTVLVENASPFNADIHMAHTLADAITLAEIAGIGV